MPEMIEIEMYRRQAEAVVGRTIAAVPAIDALGLRGADPETVRHELTGLTVRGTDRIGKLLMLATDGPVVGLRFGMTGRLLVDGGASIDQLAYGSAADNSIWDRLIIEFSDGSELRVRDPRRLGGLELEPDLSRFGPDAATIEAHELSTALGRSVTALKARLLDQHRVAGLGNLLVDEILWRAGLDPAREARSLTEREVTELAATITDTVADLTRRGGSHTGDLQTSRERGAHCPRDGTALQRRTIGGRTTYSCPQHQR